MTTIAIGQWVTQGETGRVWQIMAELPRSIRGDPRWSLRLEELGPLDTRGERFVGQTTSCSTNWLNLYCHDYRSGVDPPLGDGIQKLRYTTFDGIVAETTVLTALEACAQARGWLDANEGYGQVEWFGWDVDGESEPDLTCVLVNGELEWNEYRVSVS